MTYWDFGPLFVVVILYDTNWYCNGQEWY